jgi:hypothetical protein
MMNLHKNNLKVELDGIPAIAWNYMPDRFFSSVFGYELAEADKVRRQMLLAIEAQDGSAREIIRLDFVGGMTIRAVEPVVISSAEVQTQFDWSARPCLIYSTLTAGELGVDLFKPTESYQTDIFPSSPVMEIDLSALPVDVVPSIVLPSNSAVAMPTCKMRLRNSSDTARTITGQLYKQDGSLVEMPVLGRDHVKTWYLELLVHCPDVWDDFSDSARLIVLQDVRL